MELLSPAGSMEALRAAVQNGANAVYLGYGAFNARMNAKNFATPEQLQEAVCYCHTRGVGVHLTLNTLSSDRELAQVQKVVCLAAKAGVDALIVQDWGLVSLCRELAPRVKIHGSTQMSIHSLEGVKKAAQLGCSRVVLARELPRQEIAYICRNSPIEVEVFAHGALCMGYSGQCYLSSVVGQRSGNRGRCAQPCRLPYGYGRSRICRIWNKSFQGRDLQTAITRARLARRCLEPTWTAASSESCCKRPGPPMRQARSSGCQ